MNSDDNYSEDENSQEINFGNYYQVDKNADEDDDFEESESLQHPEPKKPQTKGKANEEAPPPLLFLSKEPTGGNQFKKQPTTKKEPNQDDDNYESDDAKEIKFEDKGSAQMNDDDFEDSNQFNPDTFKYDKKDFEVSESEESMKVVKNNETPQNFSIHKENPVIESNPFREKAMVQTITNNNQPTLQKQQTRTPANQHPVRQSQQSAKEIQFKDDIKTESEIDIDDEINESVQDDFDASRGSKMSDKLRQMVKQNQQQPDNGSTVNMGSVVPNPKLFSTAMNTVKDNIQQRATGGPKQMPAGNPKINQNNKSIKEETYVEFEMQSQSNIDESIGKQAPPDKDSMQEINEHLEKIPAKWSPPASPKQAQVQNQTNKRKVSQQPKDTQKPTIPKSDKEPRKPSGVRPQSAKPLNAIQAKTGTQGIKAVTKKRAILGNNNNDISDIMQEEDKECGNEEEKKEETKTLLQQKQAQKSTRKIIRPDSAKPKVGYEGKPNALVKEKPPSANTNDLTAQLAKSKKFQMIKKLKEEKERKKDMVVRNLQKVNVLQKQKQQTQQKKEETKKPNADLEEDGFFEEGEEIKGDQAGNPMMEDNMRIDEPDPDDFIDQDLLNGSGKRQTLKDLVNQKQPPVKTQTPQAQTQAQQWVGNALGSGQFQQVNETINRPNTIMQLEPQRSQKPPDVVSVNKEQGWNSRINALDGSKQINNQGGGDAANMERFNQILRDKKEKAVNKDVLGFMAEKAEKMKQEKKEALQQNINKLAKDFDVKDKQTNQANKGSDKVPEFAKLVVDDEKLSKELMDLKRRVREINLENIKIQSNIRMVENRKRQKENQLDQIMQSKNLVSYNGSLQVQEMGKSRIGFGFKMEEIPNYDQIEKERINPLDSVVKKIERRGYTLDQCFNLFDDNGDQVLTIQEIKQGLKDQNIELTDTEMQELVNQIDKNADGVLTIDEWLNTLNPKFDTEKQYREIMQNIDIDDPIELEEKILDLKYRTQRLDNELEILRETSGNEQGFNAKERMKRKMKNPLQKKFAEKIKVLEARVGEKMGLVMFEKITIENKIKQGLMIKDQVYQDFYETERLKERQETEYSMRLQTIQDHLNVLDHKLNEVTQLGIMFKSDREQLKSGIARMQVKVASMSEMETKLDKQLEEILGRAVDGSDLAMLYELDLKTLRQLNSGSNQKFDNFVRHFASITIQRVIRGHLGRKECKIVRFQMQRLAKKLQPLVRDKLQSKRVKAAIRIQRSFRRFRARRQQLEALRRKNQAKRLREEEDHQTQEEQRKLHEAALVIAKHWRKYKQRQLRDITKITRLASLRQFGQTIEVVYLPSVKKCNICRRNTASRQCPPCNQAVYCENCFTEYHARGHRKLHSYKRIRYGQKPPEEEKIESFNQSLNIQGNNQPSYEKSSESVVSLAEDSFQRAPPQLSLGRDPTPIFATQTQKQESGYKKENDANLNNQQIQPRKENPPILEVKPNLSLAKEIAPSVMDKEQFKSSDAFKSLKDEIPLVAVHHKSAGINNQGKQNFAASIFQNQEQQQQLANQTKKQVSFHNTVDIQTIKKNFAINKIEFAEELRFMCDDEDENLMRLDRLGQVLSCEGVFKLSKEEVEKLKEFAYNNCQTDNPLEDQDNANTWIDIEGFISKLENIQ